ncbi:hypothetical protein [Micromonospora sp. NPDC048169]|uniref:hypothetical protein n=1 Tax=Micromonospora sp. NPDC048169 TaxID=3154711 RepID=UPI0033F347AC
MIAPESARQITEEVPDTEIRYRFIHPGVTVELRRAARRRSGLVGRRLGYVAMALLFGTIGQSVGFW